MLTNLNQGKDSKANGGSSTETNDLVVDTSTGSGTIA
jgi:hypothetical protein